MKTISIPTNIPTRKSIFCKIVPKIEFKEVRYGVPIQFNVKIDSCAQIESIEYLISFDTSEWMMSGSSNGFAKVTWSIEYYS